MDGITHRHRQAPRTRRWRRYTALQALQGTKDSPDDLGAALDIITAAAHEQAGPTTDARRVFVVGNLSCAVRDISAARAQLAEIIVTAGGLR